MPIRALFLTLLLIFALCSSGCGVINALGDPPDDDDVGSDDVGVDDVGSDDVGVGDADVPDVAPIDADAAPPEDADVQPAECSDGDERSCDCDDLPDEDIEGEQICENETWGECRCPEVCNDPVTGPVIAGSECGLCGAGVYDCDGDQAICSEPGPVNDCGGCTEQPEHSTCGADTERYCLPDGTRQCLSSSAVDVTVDGLADFDGVDDISLFFTFIEGADGDEDCSGWEAGVAAANPPNGYRSVSDVDAANETVELDLPDGDIDPGVLRLALRQPLYFGDDDETRQQITHFGCAEVSPDAVFNENAGIDMTLDIFPHLLRGDYQMNFRNLRWPVVELNDDEQSMNDHFHFAILATWVVDAMITFLGRPGMLFTGCEQDCPRDSFASLFERYDDALDWNDGAPPQLSGWSDFYDAWNSLDDDYGIDDDAIIDAYQQALENHEEEELDNLPSGFHSWRSNYYSLDSDGLPVYERNDFFLLDSVADYLYPTDPLADGEGGIQAQRLKIAPLNETCDSVGGSGPYKCMPVPDHVEAPTVEPSNLSWSMAADMANIQNLSATLIPLPINELLEQLYFEFLPGQFHPNVVEETDGEFTNFVEQPWDDVSDMLRNIAPCDEIAAHIADADQTDDSAGEAFEPLCDDIYGEADPDEGLNLLRRIPELMHLSLTDRIAADIYAQSCTPVFYGDAVQGFRLGRLAGEDDIEDHCISHSDMSQNLFGSGMSIFPLGGSVSQVPLTDMIVDFDAIAY